MSRALSPSIRTLLLAYVLALLFVKYPNSFLIRVTKASLNETQAQPATHSLTLILVLNFEAGSYIGICPNLLVDAGHWREEKNASEGGGKI